MLEDSSGRLYTFIRYMVFFFLFWESRWQKRLINFIYKNGILGNARHAWTENQMFFRLLDLLSDHILIKSFCASTQYIRQNFIYRIFFKNTIYIPQNISKLLHGNYSYIQLEPKFPSKLLVCHKSLVNKPFSIYTSTLL